MQPDTNTPEVTKAPAAGAERPLSEQEKRATEESILRHGATREEMPRQGPGQPKVFTENLEQENNNKGETP